MPKQIAAVIVASISLLLLASCANSPSSSVADTSFPYTILSPDVRPESYRRVLIAPVNFGKPSRKYLRDYEDRVDSFVRERLEQSGFSLVSSALFQDSWDEAVRRFGSPFNPTTGAMNERRFATVLQSVFEALRERQAIDAVLFTDLLQREITYSGGIGKRMARWDGVSRNLDTTGTGTGVPNDFNWAVPVDAVTLLVNMFDIDLRALFQGAGGIEVTQSLRLKGTPKFVRRKDVLANRRHIEEGVSLALHPLIEMPGYPGPTQPYAIDVQASPAQ